MIELHPATAAALTTANISYRPIECDSELADTAAFCARYGFSLDQSANTIIVASKSEPVKYAVCVVLATTKLDVNKTVRHLLGVKRISFASAEDTVRLSGMMIGGVVAIGIDDLPIYVDSAVMEQQEVVMGGGNRTSKILLDPKELSKLPRVEIIPDLAKPKDLIS